MDSDRQPTYCIDLVDEQRARQLARAPNARAIRKRKTGQIVEIHLRSFGDDSNEPARPGNPRRRSSSSETASNPQNVWYLKNVRTADEHLYRLSVTDCLKRAA